MQSSVSHYGELLCIADQWQVASSLDRPGKGDQCVVERLQHQLAAWSDWRRSDSPVKKAESVNLLDPLNLPAQPRLRYTEFFGSLSE